MITEPTTLATDYVLGALCAALAWRLRAKARVAKQRAMRRWAQALAATAVGSFAGGTYHGFGTMLPAQLARAMWAVTTIVVGLAACLLLSATLTAAVPRRARRWLLTAVWAQFAVYAAWMLRHDAFVNVVVEYGLAMLFVLLLHLAAPRLRREPSTRWVIAGVVLTFTAAGVQQSGFDLHRHLNHNDLQHLVQMVAVWLLYKGGSNLRDTPV
jgi:drug/metabolite transporter (DMT)-like permease